MTQITVSDLAADAEKYVDMAQDQDILITEDGKLVARLVAAKADKKASLNHLMNSFGGLAFTDEDVRDAREEHLQ
ncbi:MAG: hypothetical protein LUC17_02940 [Oscillospiraceae bacterium]|nr:hypothetical protein [Oscillospiraceae bacterium]